MPSLFVCDGLFASAALVEAKLHMLTQSNRWEHKPGLTLIGDAASLMTPFAGEGVNKAMRDSLELANLLTAAFSSPSSSSTSKSTTSTSPDSTLKLDTAVSQYETSMFPRAAKVQAETERNKRNMFGPGAPGSFMTGMMQGASVEFGEGASWWMKCLFWGLGSWPVVGAVGGWFWFWQVLGRGRRAWRGT